MSKRKTRLKNKRKINNNYIYEKRITGMLLGGEMSRHIENERELNRGFITRYKPTYSTEKIGMRRWL